MRALARYRLQDAVAPLDRHALGRPEGAAGDPLPRARGPQPAAARRADGQPRHRLLRGARARARRLRRHGRRGLPRPRVPAPARPLLPARARRRGLLAARRGGGARGARRAHARRARAPRQAALAHARSPLARRAGAGTGPAHRFCARGGDRHGHGSGSAAAWGRAASRSLLALCCGGAGARRRTADLERYAAGTWASMVAMTDEESGLPTDLLDGRRHARRSRPRSRTSARTCGASSAPSRPGSSATTRRSSGSSRPSPRSRGWSATRAASSTTGTTTGRGRSSPSGRRAARTQEPRPLVGRQRLARGRAEGRQHQRARRSPSARARSTTRCTGASTTTRPATRSTSTSSRGTGQRALLLRHDRLREPDRVLHRHRQGRDPARSTTSGRTARSRTRCDWSWTETRPVGYTRTYYGRPTYDGALRVRRHAGHAELGRQHVRGADAVALPARGGVGPGQLGREPPAHRGGADPPRDGGGRLRLLGLLALREPRAAATPSTASTASAATRTATRPTTTDADRPRLARLPGPPGAAGPAAVGLHERRRHAARRVPRAAVRAATRRWRTSAGSSATSPGSTARSGFRDAVNVDTGTTSGLLPVARPGHGDGGRRSTRSPATRCARRSRRRTWRARCGR